MRIGIDIMGGETSPQQFFQAILQATAKCYPACHFVVIATSEIIDELSAQRQSGLSPQAQAHLTFVAAEEVITMDDDPLVAVRRKKKSSLIIGVDLVKKHYLNAFITAGNTGALIAYSTLTVPLLPQIKRPALLATLPTHTGHLAVLDVGGNTTCKAEHLVQFARMGAAYQHCMHGIAHPRIGLLNMGVEPVKGPSEIRKAYRLLQQEVAASADEIHFVGNIEGRDVFCGNIDVLVTEGFSGNIFLKTAEGMADFVFSQLQNLSVNADKKDGSLWKLEQITNCNTYPGAIICGIEKVIIKCHGNASISGMLHALEGAIQCCKKEIVDKIKERLS